MSTAKRFLMVIVCSVLSLPAGLFGLMGTVAKATEPCGGGVLPGACALHHHLGQAMLVAFFVAWSLYGWLALCWLANQRPGLGVRVVGTVSALGYSVLAACDEPAVGLGILGVTIMPVLPAVLLATYVVFYFRPEEPLRVAPSLDA